MKKSKYNILVYVNDKVSEKGTAESISHELYVHALFDAEGKNSSRSRSIRYGTDFDSGESTDKIVEIIEQNSELGKEIIDRVNEAIKNYN